MGGTDLIEVNINWHRISVCGKKWQWSIFTWFLDASVQNAKQIHKRVGLKLTLLDLKKEIVTQYLQYYGSHPRGAGHASISKAIVCS